MKSKMMVWLGVAVFGSSTLMALEVAELRAGLAALTQGTPEERAAALARVDRVVDKAAQPAGGDAAAVTRVLAGMLRTADLPAEEAVWALRALARVGTAEAVPAVVARLEKGDSRIAGEALATLSAIGTGEAREAIERSLRALAGARPNRSAVDALFALERAKLGHIEALGRIGDTASLALLSGMTLDANPAIGQAALAAIGRIGGPEAVDLLRRALASNKLQADRKMAAELALLDAAEEDGTTAAAAIRITTTPAARVAALDTLVAQSAAAESAGVLDDALRSEDRALRHAALVVAISTGHAQTPKRLEDVVAEDRAVFLARLAELKPAARAEAVAREGWGSPLESERILAVEGMGRLGTPAALEMLLEAIQAREARVSQAAARAIAGFAHADTDAGLLDLLKTGEGGLRLAAIKACAARPVPGAAAVLMEIASGGGDEAAAREAQRSLVYMASLEDLKALCALVENAAPARRGALVSAAKRISERLGDEQSSAWVEGLPTD